MNYSLYNLDRATHLKIVVVAAITAALVLIIGESAQLDRNAPVAAAPASMAAPGPNSALPADKPGILARAIG